MSDTMTSTSEPGPDERPRRSASPDSNGLRPDARLDPSPRLVTLLEDARQRVSAHVRQRRAEGASIERVIPELRCLVREAQSCEEWYDPTDFLMAVVVGWAVDSFYDGPPLPHVGHDN